MFGFQKTSLFLVVCTCLVVSEQDDSVFMMFTVYLCFKFMPINI